MRKFQAVISKHRPDGLTTLWFRAKPQFSDRERLKKTAELMVDVSKKCKRVFVSTTMDVEASWNEKLEITKPITTIEVVGSKQCIEHSLKTAKKNWKGKWRTRDLRGRKNES